MLRKLWGTKNGKALIMGALLAVCAVALLLASGECLPPISPLPTPTFESPISPVMW
jgi:hypothetical protein